MKWRQYSQSITIPKPEPKDCTYGLVKYKNGKIGFRNYHRPIKSGLSFLDIVELKLVSPSQ